MVKKNSDSKTGGRNGGNTGKNGGSGYKGVRMRKWGKWVCEIRVPKSRDRIWLGSYDTAEKAAKAYDAGVFCMRGGGVGEIYNLNFPQNRSELETLLSSHASSSSSSTPALNQGNQVPSYLTRSQIQVLASKYANSTNDVATVAPALPINSHSVFSALPIADANFGFLTNSPDGSSALPTNSLDMSSTFSIADANLMNLCHMEKVIAASPMEPLMVENWHLNNSNCNDVMGSNQFYNQECHAVIENRYSPVITTIEGQGAEGLLEDVLAPRGISGGGNSGNGDVFY